MAKEVEKKKKRVERTGKLFDIHSARSGQRGQTSSIAYFGVELGAAESRFMCFINSVICSQTHPRMKEVMKPPLPERKLLA